MRELFPGIFTWGGPYPDVPWDLNGYAIRCDDDVVLIDPPEPSPEDLAKLNALQPVTKIIITNRSHTRDAEAFRTRYHAPIAAGADEVGGLAPLTVDETLPDGDLVAGRLRVIYLPGKSPGEIGLLFASSPATGGILLLGDAIIGHPPGQLGLIPAAKLDNPAQLKQSLQKLRTLDFDMLLLCDGQPLLCGAKQRVVEFLDSLE